MADWIGVDMFKRIAKCGHAYYASSPQGKTRHRCDDCRREWDARPERPNHKTRAAVANAARWTRAVAASCKHCDGPLAAARPTGPRSSYCSTSCRGRASYARRKDRINAERRKATASALAAVVKACKHCGAEFTPGKSRRQKFCTKKCGNDFFRDASGRSCAAADCDRPVRARGVCDKHYKATLRADGRLKPPQWDDRRRDAYHRRRAMKLSAATGAPVLRDEIAARDAYMCGLCAEPVDMSVQWPHALSPTLDHIVPLALGGAHGPENVQLAHLTCNSSKGSRLTA